MRKIKVGIAGLGRSGWGIHAADVATLPDKYEIYAVFDPCEDRRREAKKRFACRTYDNYEKLIADEDVELVIVASPNKRHCEHSIKALKAGKHVVCEKPMATSLDDADKMLKAAAESVGKLTVYQSRRYSPEFVKICEIINSGVLGRIVMIRMAYHGFKRRADWQTLKKNDGGELNNTMPHPLDQAVVLFGEAEPEVFCIRDKTLTLGDADDHVKLILSGKNSPTIEIEITSACPYGQDNWLVMGTQGGLSGTFNELRWKYFNPEELEDRKVVDGPAPERSYGSEVLPQKEFSWSINDDKSAKRTGFYLDLYEILCNGKEMTIKPEQVRRQMVILEKCREIAPV
jgi:predicted dehydrogenase